MEKKSRRPETSIAGDGFGTPVISQPLHEVRACLVTASTDSPGQLQRYPGESWILLYFLMKLLL